MSEPTTVKINILGKDYQVGTTEARRDALTRVHKYLNERMAEAKKDHDMSSNENIAVMTALNLAHELMSRTDALSDQAGRLRKIKDKLDALETGD